MQPLVLVRARQLGREAVANDRVHRCRAEHAHVVVPARVTRHGASRAVLRVDDDAGVAAANVGLADAKLVVENVLDGGVVEDAGVVAPFEIQLQKKQRKVSTSYKVRQRMKEGRWRGERERDGRVSSGRKQSG